MLSKVTTLAIVVSLLIWPALAKPGATLATDEYRLVIAPGAKVSDRTETAWETKMTVEQDGQKAKIRWKKDEFTVIFPTLTMHLKMTPSGGDGYQLTTDFAGQRYMIGRSPREVSWKMPGQDVFFRTWGGRVTEAVGTSDFLKVQRDTKSGRVTLESSAGTSDVLLKKGALEVFDGPAVLEHVYFVRGLAFRHGPITLQIPFPEEPFMNALPKDRYLMVLGPEAPAVDTTSEPEAVEPGVDGDPLRADSPSWESPVYRANQSDGKEDPLKARREERVKHPEDPLRATPQKDSEEVLRVKDY